MPKTPKPKPTTNPAPRRASAYYDALTFQPLAAPPPGALIISPSSGSDHPQSAICNPQSLVGPAFFDPQVNGYAGADFQDPNLTRDALEHAVRALQQVGCAHLLATLVTAAPAALTEQFRLLASLIDQSALLRSAILGFHLEGPFISADQFYAGAHPAAFTCDPDWRLFTRWQKASGNRIRLVTVAPEREGSVDFIRRAAHSGVWVSLGHTNATSGQLQAAVAAGARLFTHLGNGCPGMMPRHDNIIQRGVALHSLFASVIPDGIHIPPPALGNLLRALGPGRIVFTTDVMAAGGMPPGRFRLGGIEVMVGTDGAVRNPSGHGLAGSSLNPLQGFYNAIRFGGLGADAAWRGWTHLRDAMFPGVEPPALVVPFF
jgi:N-acetylglucosamine-6-phosphate deacetylase